MNKSGIIEEKQRYNAPFLRAFDMLAAQIADGKQKNLAEMMGTYSSHISDYRKGKKRVSQEIMDALIRVSELTPDGTLNRYYLTGRSKYMLLKNVPDEELIAQQGREFDPDYDLLHCAQQKKEPAPSSSTTKGLASVGSPVGTQKQSEKDIIDLATSLIVELEHLRQQTQQELALLAQARQSFESATAQLQKILTSPRHDYFPNLAAEDSQPTSPNQ